MIGTIQSTFGVSTVLQLAVDGRVVDILDVSLLVLLSSESFASTTKFTIIVVAVDSLLMFSRDMLKPAISSSVSYAVIASPPKAFARLP